MSPEEQEKFIHNLMTESGLTRQDAEFALAIELGEISGDVDIPDADTPPRTILDR